MAPNAEKNETDEKTQQETQPAAKKDKVGKFWSFFCKNYRLLEVLRF